MNTNKVETLNETATITLEVLSPLHIGGATEKNWVRNIDFYDTGDEIVIIDQSKLLKALVQARTTQNISGLKAYENLLASKKSKQLKVIMEDCNIDLESIQLKSFKTAFDPSQEIRPLIRNGMGQTIIPGSSIKGAIRSALFHNLYKEFNPPKRKEEEQLFGNISNNLMRFIRPYDAICDQTEIINCRLFNLYQEHGNWISDYKKDLIISIECFKPGGTAQFRLAIASGLYKILKGQNDRQRKKYYTPKYGDRVINIGSSVKTIFQTINQYIKTHIDREIAFFRRFQNEAEDVEYILDNLVDYRKETEMPDQCVFRMSFGSGFHGITGDWWFKDHTQTVFKLNQKNRDTKYKSRKVIGTDTNTTLMGFVKLKL